MTKHWLSEYLERDRGCNVLIYYGPLAPVLTRAGKSKSLIRSLEKAKRREKEKKGRKGEFDLQLDFWQTSTSLVEMS